jgi:hypothetical protein
MCSASHVLSAASDGQSCNGRVSSTSEIVQQDDHLIDNTLVVIGDGDSALVDDTLVVIGDGNSGLRHAESVNQVDVYSFEEGRIVTQLGHEGFDRRRIGCTQS